MRHGTRTAQGVAAHTVRALAGTSTLMYKPPHFISFCFGEVTVDYRPHVPTLATAILPAFFGHLATLHQEVESISLPSDPGWDSGTTLAKRTKLKLRPCNFRGQAREGDVVSAWFFFSCDAGPWHLPCLPARRKPKGGHLEEVTWCGTEASLDNSQHGLAESDMCEWYLVPKPSRFPFSDLKLFSAGTRHDGAETNHLPRELSRFLAQRLKERKKWLFSPINSGGTVCVTQPEQALCLTIQAYGKKIHASR